MSSDEITPTSGAVELSDRELDEVAGGFSLLLSAAFFRQTNVSADRETHLGSGYSSSKSTFSMENTQSAGIQIAITDASASDLTALSGILGGATAIEG
jgi:hypothetical protein